MLLGVLALRHTPHTQLHVSVCAPAVNNGLTVTGFGLSRSSLGVLGRGLGTSRHPHLLYPTPLTGSTKYLLIWHGQGEALVRCRPVMYATFMDNVLVVASVGWYEQDVEMVAQVVLCVRMPYLACSFLQASCAVVPVVHWCASDV